MIERVRRDQNNTTEDRIELTPIYVKNVTRLYGTSGGSQFARVDRILLQPPIDVLPGDFIGRDDLIQPIINYDMISYKGKDYLLKIDVGVR